MPGGMPRVSSQGVKAVGVAGMDAAGAGAGTGCGVAAAACSRRRRVSGGVASARVTNRQRALG